MNRNEDEARSWRVGPATRFEVKDDGKELVNRPSNDFIDWKFKDLN